MLLNTYKYHYTETNFIFTLFVPMSQPRSIYVVSMWYFFHFHFTFIFNFPFFCSFAYFSEYGLYYFWIKTWMKNVNNFQITKVQMCCLAFAWFFANFSLALLIKVLLIKKACSYDTVPRAIWPMFADLFHEHLGEWNNNKMLLIEINIDHIKRDKHAITSLSLTYETSSVLIHHLKAHRHISKKWCFEKYFMW